MHRKLDRNTKLNNTKAHLPKNRSSLYMCDVLVLINEIRYHSDRCLEGKKRVRGKKKGTEKVLILIAKLSNNRVESPTLILMCKRLNCLFEFNWTHFFFLFGFQFRFYQINIQFSLINFVQQRANKWNDFNTQIYKRLQIFYFEHYTKKFLLTLVSKGISESKGDKQM